MTPGGLLTLDGVPDESRGRVPYPELLARLSRQSVTKHFDAYADVDWDAPAHRIDPDDPRWELSGEHALGATAWYRTRPPGVRSRIGLHLVASEMKLGLQFENVLKRGLLEFALTLPNGAPEFRYAYHETIEEAQHALMFQEFVNRTGFDVPGLGALDRIGSRHVVTLARRFPALFFVFVLGGEEPIDHVQRESLRRGAPMHPLLRRVMTIHVTEEARHLSFARRYLREHVPRLGPVRRAWLALRVPTILGIMAQMMLRPSGHVVRTYDIPRAVIREGYTRNLRHRAEVIASLAKVRSLCAGIGLVTGPSYRLWRAFGIWPAGEATA